MRIKRPLAPPFINRLDEYLLLNKPEIWSARTHLVVYYGILFMALLAGLAFIVPDDPRMSSDAGSWMGFVSLISIVAFVGWIIYLLRSNVFKRYGITSPVNRVITFGLYFVAIGMLVMFLFVKSYVETVRANAAYTDEEIVKDINAMNVGVTLLEYDSIDHKWRADTVLVTDQDEEVVIRDGVTTDEEVVRIRETISPESLRKRLAREDSVRKLNDSMYIFFQCPDYTLLYNYYDASHFKILSSVDIYRRYIVNYMPPNKQQLARELHEIRKKYEVSRDYKEYYGEESDVVQRIRERHGLGNIYTAMSNILGRKHRWDADDLPVWLRFLFYPTLAFTLLVFAFRHTTTRTFALTLLTAVILLIFTSLVLAFSRFEDETVLNSIIVYFIIAFGISVTAFTIRKRSVATGIGLNIFLWLLPFIPLCIVLRYYEWLQGQENNELNYGLKQQHLFMGEVIGIVLLLLSIGTYFHYAYKKWYAAPEN